MQSHAVVSNQFRAWDAFATIRGRRYASCRFSNWEAVIYSPQFFAMENVKTYVTDWQKTVAKGCGLILIGPCGTGKDHLLSAAAYEFVARGGLGEFGTLAWTSGALLFAMSKPTAEQMKQYQKASVLIVSDPCEAGYQLSKTQTNLLQAIIDHRYSQKRATWISTNAASREHLETMIGAPIVDRLVDGALVIATDWPSFRTPSVAKGAEANGIR
jgi:DNA replication protein DnaC